MSADITDDSDLDQELGLVSSSSRRAGPSSSASSSSAAAARRVSAGTPTPNEALRKAQQLLSKYKSMSASGPGTAVGSMRAGAGGTAASASSGASAMGSRRRDRKPVTSFDLGLSEDDLHPASTSEADDAGVAVGGRLRSPVLSSVHSTGGDVSPVNMNASAVGRRSHLSAGRMARSADTPGVSSRRQRDDSDAIEIEFSDRDDDSNARNTSSAAAQLKVPASTSANPSGNTSTSSSSRRKAVNITALRASIRTPPSGADVPHHRASTGGVAPSHGLTARAPTSAGSDDIEIEFDDGDDARAVLPASPPERAMARPPPAGAAPLSYGTAAAAARAASDVKPSSDDIMVEFDDDAPVTAPSASAASSARLVVAVSAPSPSPALTRAAPGPVPASGVEDVLSDAGARSGYETVASYASDYEVDSMSVTKPSPKSSLTVPQGAQRPPAGVTDDGDDGNDDEDDGPAVRVLGMDALSDDDEDKQTDSKNENPVTRSSVLQHYPLVTAMGSITTTAAAAATDVSSKTQAFTLSSTLRKPPAQFNSAADGVKPRGGLDAVTTAAVSVDAGVQTDPVIIDPSFLNTAMMGPAAGAGLQGAASACSACGQHVPPGVGFNAGWTQQYPPYAPVAGGMTWGRLQSPSPYAHSHPFVPMQAWDSVSSFRGAGDPLDPTSIPRGYASRPSSPYHVQPLDLFSAPVPTARPPFSSLQMTAGDDAGTGAGTENAWQHRLQSVMQSLQVCMIVIITYSHCSDVASEH